MSHLTLGVIGSGDIARTAHVPVLKTLEDTTLAWVADVDEGRASEMGKAYKVPHIVLDKSGGEPPKADVVLLSTPYGVRKSYYDSYRDQGTSLYVEKPFARSAEEHESICSWFPDYALNAGLMMRSWWANQMVRELVDSQIFGPLKKIRFAHGRPGMVTYGRYYLDTSKGGGGMLAEFGIHGLDSMLFVTDAKSSQIDKVQTVWDGDVDMHTRAHLTLERSGQKVEAELLVTGIEDLVEGMELEFENTILSYLLPGQGYALEGDTVDLRVSVQSKSGGPSYELNPRDSRIYPETKFQMFHDFWSQFLKGIRNQESNDTSAFATLLTTKVLEEIGAVAITQK